MAVLFGMSTGFSAQAADFATEQLKADLAALYPQTVARPLFAPTRLPKPAPPAPAPVALVTEAPKIVPVAYTPPPPRLVLSTYRLRGVMMTGTRQSAILEHVASGKTFRVIPGPVTLPDADGAEMTIDITEIRAQSVTLEADTAIILQLRKSPGLVAPAPAQVADDPVGTVMAKNTPAQTLIETTDLEKYLAPLTPTTPNRLRRMRVVAMGN